MKQNEIKKYKISNVPFFLVPISGLMNVVHTRSVIITVFRLLPLTIKPHHHDCLPTRANSIIDSLIGKKEYSCRYSYSSGLAQSDFGRTAHRLMAAPSQLLPSKLALDQLIKSYLEAAAEVPERAKMEAFEAGYFRDVVGGSQASTADLVSVASFEHLLSWVACSLDMVRPELLTLSYHLFVKR